MSRNDLWYFVTGAFLLSFRSVFFNVPKAPTPLLYTEESLKYLLFPSIKAKSVISYQSSFFKPTLAFGDQTFRNDKKGALAYFVGGDPDYPNDKGFALTPWVKARYDNAGNNNEGIQIYGSVAITMGNVWVTDKFGKDVMVDKTWVFKKGRDGKLRIIVHKSALPYSPSAKKKTTGLNLPKYPGLFKPTKNI